VLVGFVLPGGVPPGIYSIEAVLLDPQDVTISQDSVEFAVAP
jgi:hypothetical protein